LIPVSGWARAFRIPIGFSFAFSSPRATPPCTNSPNFSPPMLAHPDRFRFSPASLFFISSPPYTLNGQNYRRDLCLAPMFCTIFTCAPCDSGLGRVTPFQAAQPTAFEQHFFLTEFSPSFFSAGDRVGLPLLLFDKHPGRLWRLFFFAV